MPQVISGFPGIGKTHFSSLTGGVSDSDSSHFSWAPTKGVQVRDPRWPQNYIEHIQGLLLRPEISFILVPSHQEVRDALVEAGIPFTLVYPSVSIKEEYIQRYVDRGSAPAFVSLLNSNYETWIEGLISQQNCDHLSLGVGEYLSDVL